jgi:hypothetical protein
LRLKIRRNRAQNLPMTRTAAPSVPDVIDRVLVMAVHLHPSDEADAVLHYARVMLRNHIPHVLPAILHRAEALSMDAASAGGKVRLLRFWMSLRLGPKYTQGAMNWASRNGHVAVLDWWAGCGLGTLYSAHAMNWASRNGHVPALDWWVQSGLELKYSEGANERGQYERPHRCARLVGQVGARTRKLGEHHGLGQPVRPR